MAPAERDGASPRPVSLEAPSEVVERVLDASRAKGDVQGRMVVVEDGTEVEVRFANNTTTTNGIRRQRRVTVITVKAIGGGLAAGVATRSGSADLEELIAASEADAEQSPPADDAFPFVDPALSEDFAALPAATDLSALRTVLDELPAAFDRARSEGHVLYGFATHEVDTVYLGTSAGVRLRHEQPTGSVELVARSPEGTRSAWAGRGTARFEDVSLTAMHEDLRRRLRWAERRVELDAGRYETILPPDATADFTIFLFGDLSGRDAEDGRSVFSAAGGGTKLGQRIASIPFDLRSDPAEPGLECTPFLVTTASGSDVSLFDNGLPLERTSWIESGKLERLFYHRAAAQRSDVAVAPPVDNLVLEQPGASRSVNDMVSDTRRGLLLTCLWYIRTVDPVTALLTGLTRDGVYLVENGEVVGAVNNFRFNESPVDLLARATEVGASERAYSRESGEWMNRTAMPALRVPDFNMSSVSPAT
jgi:predicted Zn-dependent protease